MTKLTALALFAVVSTAFPVAAQDGPELPEAYREAIPFQPEVLGSYTFAISSENDEAQQFFTQGMQLMYSFAKTDAVRSFREAWKRDPDCAICYWGEAWALGLVSERADAPAGGAARLRGAAESAATVRGACQRT